MQTPPIKLIPAEYLERVKGPVETRKMLARKPDLPKVVLDRLVCDRSRSVREVAARNPKLDAEQVQKLIDDRDSSIIYELNRNHHLSHELVALQVRDYHGVRDNNLFRNPNIKAAEFVGLVKEYVTTSGSSHWSKRGVYGAAAHNPGVGNGAIIALTEMVYKEDSSVYVDVIGNAFRNESLSSRSIKYLLDRAEGRVSETDFTTLSKTAVQRPNASDSLVDSVVTARLDQGVNVLREFQFSDNYVASETVIEKISANYPNGNSERYLEFLVKHIPADRLTPERIAVAEFTQNSETATVLILKGVELSEGSIDRLVMVVAMSSDCEYIDRLNREFYIKSHHIDEMAKSSSWSVRRRAAGMYNISEETLKGLATDSDSDVRQSVRENPKWEIIKDAVDAQEAAYRFSEKVRALSRHAEEISTSLLEKYDEEYNDLKSIVAAINVLADPKTRELINSFKVEESRNLMKDGIDTDTLSLLKDFF
jgi:hypothetical protein